MGRLIFHVLTTSLLTFLSCEKNSSNNYCKYNLVIKEIDGNNNQTVISFKNVFISSKKGLFEYDFKSLSKSITDGNTIKNDYKEDSVTLSYIPINKPFFYKFNFDGNLLAKDSIKNKRNNFIKIDRSNNTSDPLYAIINSLSEKYLTDTSINNINFKTYKHPNVIKDSVGDMTLQLFFISDKSLITPFNVNNRYPIVLNKYSLAGLSNNIIKMNRKFIILIDNMTELTDAETILCDKICKKKYVAK